MLISLYMIGMLIVAYLIIWYLEYRREGDKFLVYAKYDKYHKAKVIRVILIKALKIKYNK